MQYSLKTLETRPFHADDVPKHTVATMSALVEDIQRVVDVPIGVNVLRNDAKAALSIAAATAASFIRVNVHVGTRVTDQGIVTGHAAETLRLREHLRTDVEILADISVKHSAPVAERPLTETVTDSIKRGHADGIIATGVETGREIDRDHLNAVVDARDDLETDTSRLCRQRRHSGDNRRHTRTCRWSYRWD